MPNRSERLEILNRLEKGEINPEEAARLLSTVEGGSPPPPQTPMGVLEQLERGQITPEEAARRLSSRVGAKEKSGRNSPNVEVIHKKATKPQRSSNWWLIPVGLGTVFALLAGLWMRADLLDGRFGLAFLCAWVPMAIGVGLLLLGWFARRGPWANVNIRSHRAGGRVRFDLDLPVPIGVAGSALHFVGDRVPALGTESVDRLLQALEQAGKDGEPIEIHANSDDEEDSVDITIS
ncbi:MAG: hypothetical protein WEC16_00940 [Anaerolineales bacterium]